MPAFKLLRACTAPAGPTLPLKHMGDAETDRLVGDKGPGRAVAPAGRLPCELCFECRTNENNINQNITQGYLRVPVL